MRNQATAPYNFVSLPVQVLKSPIEGNASSDKERQQNYREHILNNGKLNGYVELLVTTKTPVYIGIGNNESFFGPNGQPMIPGSSIRGMVKNIFKIVTCSAMRSNNSDADFNDKKLYYRSMAEKNKNIRKAYTDRMTGTDPETEKNTSVAAAGFLIHNKTDLQYYMVPTEFEVKSGNEQEIDDNSPSIKWDNPVKGQVTAYTGKMPGKCHYTIHQKPNWHNLELIDPAVIKDYKEDTTRKGVNIFDNKYNKKNSEAASFVGDDDIDFVAPCFFVREHGSIEHFGFGRYYRIPYRLSIGDHVSNNVQTESVDYTDALFGRKELWGSRIFFEDALGDSLLKEKATEKATEKAAYPRILSGPKPTSYQLYLQQSTKDIIAHWDSKDAPIRGYKMYWHKKEDWRREDKQEQDKQTTHKIQPVKADQIFHSRIRFESLSKDELGALLKVFELSEKDSNLCFKLGQGKSIGMGSVRIEAKLKLTSDDCYRKLFTDDLIWNSGDTSEEITKYTAEFDKILKEGLSATAYNRYQISQKELAYLLDWKNTDTPDWNAKTQMMSIEDADKPFQHRWKLPLANDVK